jgi:hypothetical protein
MPGLIIVEMWLKLEGKCVGIRKGVGCKLKRLRKTHLDSETGRSGTCPTKTHQQWPSGAVIEVTAGS